MSVFLCKSLIPQQLKAKIIITFVSKKCLLHEIKSSYHMQGSESINPASLNKSKVSFKQKQTVVDVVTKLSGLGKQ
jgi:hypothetical protein